MALIIKHNSETGSIPAASDMAEAELAINTYDGRLYSKLNNGNIIRLNPYTASFAATASVLLGSIESSSFATTASFAQTASLLLGSIESASWAETASYAENASAKEEHFTLYSSEPANTILENQTGSLFEYGPESRKKMILDNYNEARVSTIIHTEGYISSSLAVQYSTNNGVSWSFVDGSSAPSLSMAVTGNIAGEWVTMVSESKSDVLLRWVTEGGDSIESPSIGSIILTVR